MLYFVETLKSETSLLASDRGILLVWRIDKIGQM